MANKRIEMRKVRELLSLRFEHNMSSRKAAKIAGIGKTAASEYIQEFTSSSLDIKNISSMPDSELLAAITIKKTVENPRYDELQKQFPYIEKELKRIGVTLQLLWKEYSESHQDYYRYSSFCYHYNNWRKDKKVSMHMTHKAGDKMFVDFTGKKLEVVDPETGEVQECEVFVSVLGASGLSYMEAVASQKKADWISVNQNALHFYGGVPAAIVPDCLKSAVIKSHKYEPEINESYKDFASHYQTVILPARALHPQDKSLAENFVRNAYTHIYAPLRNQVFFSIEELNEAIWKLLDTYNQKKFQQKEYSRQELFDDIEKKELKELPVDFYELKSFVNCRVSYHHHVYLKEDKHYYSVPFELTGKILRVVYSARNVEIYHNNSRVAIHSRNFKAYDYSTKNEHRPATHKYVSDWTPERFTRWARSISLDVEEVITHILDSPEHPEQAYRTCMGLLNLAKKHDPPHYIKACKKALHINIVNYKFIKNTLETKSFNLNDEQELACFKLPEHENIRGKEMFN